VLVNHVNLSILNSLRDVMETEYPALLHIFIKDSQERVNSLRLLSQECERSGLTTTQRQQLGMMAHSFKGSSGNLGATHLEDLCRQLEKLAIGQTVVSTSQVSQLVKAIESEFAVVRDLFDVELHTTLTQY
jgi:HPt (histidine-containing phosphotransfer) domain-containing protein